MIRARQSGYTEAEKIEALVLLLAAGGDCLDDIAVLQADGGLGRLLERPLPAADTLRHFLYACHDEELIAAAQAQRPAGQVAYIPAENAALQGLARVNTVLADHPHRQRPQCAEVPGPPRRLSAAASERSSRRPAPARRCGRALVGPPRPTCRGPAGTLPPD